MAPPLVVLGCGYVGTHVARAALAQGRAVRACARGTGKLAGLGGAGAEIKYLDAGLPKQFPQIVAGFHGATLLYSIPPVTALPPGQAMRAALQAAYGAGIACFIYLSSAGLYGDRPDDDVWIDEDTAVSHDDPSMTNVLADEQTIETCNYAMRLVTLRLSPVYGPGRGIRPKLRNGTYKILDEGQHVTSRIHIEDLVRIVLAAEERAPTKALYLVADDEPTTQGEYARWLSERLGLAMPPSRSMFESGAARAAHRNRKVRNAKLKAELGIELAYRSYREGEAANDAAETTE
jgi:nucleoside-diphosphate-sugar epimerase